MRILLLFLPLQIAASFSSVFLSGNEASVSRGSLYPRVTIHEDGEFPCHGAELEQVNESIEWILRVTNWAQVAVSDMAGDVASTPYGQLFRIYREAFGLPLDKSRRAREDRTRVRRYFRALADQLRLRPGMRHSVHIHCYHMNDEFCIERLDFSRVIPDRNAVYLVGDDLCQ